jgi:hypothetical protein
MELKGRVEFISSLDKGTDKKGKEYEKAYFVISDEVGQYPNRLKIELFNKTDQMKGVKVGSMVNVQYNTGVNEYQGKHYGSCSLWKLELLSAPTTVAEVQPVAIPVIEDSDLPF